MRSTTTHASGSKVSTPMYTVTVRINSTPKIERRAPKYRANDLTETVRSRVRLSDISRRLSEQLMPEQSPTPNADTQAAILHSNAQFAIDALLLSELSRVA